MDLEIWLEMWNGQRFSTLDRKTRPKSGLFLESGNPSRLGLAAIGAVELGLIDYRQS